MEHGFTSGLYEPKVQEPFPQEIWFDFRTIFLRELNLTVALFFLSARPVLEPRSMTHQRDFFPVRPVRWCNGRHVGSVDVLDRPVSGKTGADGRQRRRDDHPRSASRGRRSAAKIHQFGRRNSGRSRPAGGRQNCSSQECGSLRN